MKYLKLVAVISSFSLCLSLAQAQDAGTMASSAFRQGHYSDAAQLYDAAASVASDADKKNEYYAAAKKSRTCNTLLSQIKSLYGAAQESGAEEDYEKVKEKCQELIKYNKYDTVAQRTLLDCETQMAALARVRMEAETWARVTAGGSKELYEAYIADFPSGAHVSEARTKIKEIEDYDLWTLADEKGTIEAYQQYIANSKTGTYRSQAEAAIGALVDDDLWSMTLAAGDETAFRSYIEDPENEYKYHLQEAQAHLAVKLAIRYASMPDAEPQEVIRELEKAKGVIPFDAQTAALYQANKEEVDYQAFIALPTIRGGKDFLAEYPTGKYSDEVSNVVARLYLDSFSIYTTATDFEVARSYAKDNSLKRAITEKENEFKKQKSSASRTQSTSNTSSYTTSTPYYGTTATSTIRTGKNRVWLEVGLDYEWVKPARAVAPKIGFKFGAPSDFFNFYFGVKYQSVSSDSFAEEDVQIYPYLCHETLPVYVGMKFGLIKINTSGRVYVAVEGSYNYTIDTFVHYSDDVADMKYIPMCVNEDLWDLSGKIGIAAGWFDCGFYYKHLMNPIFNDAVTLVEGYDVLEQQGVFNNFTSKYRLGLYMNIGIRLGKKK